ncbi:MAG: hypothetical protein KDK66_00160 [Deltaproteobacteria bacterium]|nr:hypothetical protein [Deltaproteobacteria bacterium]
MSIFLSFIRSFNLFLLTLFMGLALWSCSGGGQVVPEASVSINENTSINYDLPAEWTRAEGFSDAYWEKELEPGIPFTKLDFQELSSGSEATAKNRILSAYQTSTRETCPALPCINEEKETEAKSIEVEGLTIFSSTTLAYYYGERSWQSDLSFAKDGIVYNFILYGKAPEYYSKELSLIAKTIQPN